MEHIVCIHWVFALGYGMRPLVLDACAMMHAKQLSGAPVDPLSVIDFLILAGAKVVTTSGVLQEQMDMSLSQKVTSWKTLGVYSVESVSTNEKRKIKNSIKKPMKTPGDRDVALISLASRIDGILVTHDNAAAILASKCKVITVDLLDLADLVESRKMAVWPDIESGHAKLSNFAWKPKDWTGSVQTTTSGRPHRNKLHQNLNGWPP